MAMNFDALRKGRGILNLYLSQPWELEAKIDANEDYRSYIGYSVPISVY